MNRLAVEVIVWVLSLVALKGFVEPLAAHWGKHLAAQILPPVFDALDPVILKAGLRSADLKKLIVEEILAVAEDKEIPLSDKQVDYLLRKFRELYDPLVAADKVLKDSSPAKESIGI